MNLRKRLMKAHVAAQAPWTVGKVVNIVLWIFILGTIGIGAVCSITLLIDRVKTYEREFQKPQTPSQITLAPGTYGEVELYGRAQRLQEEGKNEEALALANLLLERNPNSCDLWHLKARVSSISESIPAYRKALALALPEDKSFRWNCHYRLSAALRNTDDDAEALVQLTEALAWALPDYQRRLTLVDRSELLTKMGKFREALKDLEDIKDRENVTGPSWENRRKKLIKLMSE
jgi:hypothetical protein